VSRHVLSLSHTFLGALRGAHADHAALGSAAALATAVDACARIISTSIVRSTRRDTTLNKFWWPSTAHAFKPFYRILFLSYHLRMINCLSVHLTALSVHLKAR
jgi:hypothetical protein